MEVDVGRVAIGAENEEGGGYCEWDGLETGEREGRDMCGEGIDIVGGEENIKLIYLGKVGKP